jgi:hypothetical protein
MSVLKEVAGHLSDPSGAQVQAKSAALTSNKVQFLDRVAGKLLPRL